MLALNIAFKPEFESKLNDIKKKENIQNSSQVIRDAICLYWNFLFDANGVYKHHNEEIMLLLGYAADLPGMSLAVIQSHLVRFPKVTPEIYKRILAHMNQQHAEGKLKNPEAAAYGLCKLAQNGKLPEGIISASPAPAAQEPAPQQTLVPKEALMPFAK